MVVDLSNLDLKTRQTMDDIFRRDFDLKAMAAIERQKRVAARNHLRRPRSVPGLGAQTLEVDAFVDALWRNVYGNNYAEDPQLIKFLMRRNPEITVRSTGTRIQTGYTPAAKSWFRKVYEPKSPDARTGGGR